MLSFCLETTPAAVEELFVITCIIDAERSLQQQPHSASPCLCNASQQLTSCLLKGRQLVVNDGASERDRAVR